MEKKKSPNPKQVTVFSKLPANPNVARLLI